MNHFEVQVDLALWDESNRCYLQFSILIDGQPLESQHFVDIQALLMSLVRDGEHYIFTCSCGVPDCAGIERGILVSNGSGQVRWRLRLPVSMGNLGSDEDYEHWCATAVVRDHTFERAQMIDASNQALSRARALIADSPGKVSTCPYYISLEDLMGWQAGRMPAEANQRPETQYFKLDPDNRIDPLVISICPDYGGGWAWVDDRAPSGEGHHLPIGDGDDWMGFQPIPVPLAKRGGAWEREFAWTPISDSLHAQLDWDDYHRRGLELAIEIKRVLGPKVRIIYQKPIEDPNYRHQERVEVFEDGNCIELPSLGSMAT